MFQAVRTGDSGYNEQQRAAWMPYARSGADWHARLAQQDIIVAWIDGNIAGFMSLAPQAYIDFAYILPSAQGRGLFRTLYNKIETLAAQNGEARLWVHASLMAQPAFTAMGYSIVKKETVPIGNQTVDRFEMEKDL